MKTISQAYSEIANLKIKKIRADAERNRIFFAEIGSVYSLIKDLAVRQKITIKKPKKTVSMVLTSNYRFYGSINSDLLDYYTQSTQKIETDRIYLGKAAIEYFRATHLEGEEMQLHLPGEVKEVLLKSDQPDADELLALTNLLSDYNQVLVFYSKMKSLLVQQPTAIDITASATSHLEGEKMRLHLPGGENKQNFKFTAKQQTRFIFEPELPKILEFFDSQIITLLLEGAFLESELSRTASRFISMDQAETQANKFIKEYQTLKAYTKRNMDNNTILENFAAMMAVRRT